ncbi:MAG: thermosome subunit beta [Candidatus Bathyarchaeia archaeon]
MSSLAGRPVLILKEGTTRRRGDEARRTNIMAATVIAETLKTTLGPRGMDKMVIDSLGDITVTNDGATILDEIDVQNPAAKLMVEVAKTQDNEVGDGTTSVVVFAGELLKKARERLDQEIHPNTIVDGYRRAAEEALRVLDKVGERVSLSDEKALRNLASTAMRSKIIGPAKDLFAGIAVDAVMQIVEESNGRHFADIDNVLIQKKEGKSMMGTKLVKGIIIDKEVVHAGMAKRLEKAKIALLDTALEVKKTEMDATIRIRKAEQMKAFLDQETEMLKDMVSKIKKVGANAVFCQKGIDDLAQHFLAKEGILAVRRVKKSDMEKLARATKGRIITNLDDFKSGDLGRADLVEERKVGKDKMVFVEGCTNPKSVSILIQAGIERAVDEAERAIHDALSVVADVVEDNRIVPGAGAIEAEIAKDIRKYAEGVRGKEALAVRDFAEALEVIPTTLAENGGLDPVDAIVSLRPAHEEGKVNMGINVDGGLMDAKKEGVIEPLRVKEQIIKSSVEAATMILRIDDVIAASAKEEVPPSPEGEEGYGEY